MYQFIVDHFIKLLGIAIIAAPLVALLLELRRFRKVRQQHWEEFNRSVFEATKRDDGAPRAHAKSAHLMKPVQATRPAQAHRDLETPYGVINTRIALPEVTEHSTNSISSTNTWSNDAGVDSGSGSSSD